MRRCSWAFRIRLTTSPCQTPHTTSLQIIKACQYYEEKTAGSVDAKSLATRCVSVAIYEAVAGKFGTDSPPPHHPSTAGTSSTSPERCKMSRAF